MAGELGLAAVLPQRGWEALKAIDWSVQKPRPRHPAAATPEERETFKKSWNRPSPRSGPSTRTRRSKSGRPTSTAWGRSRSSGGCGRPKASGRSRLVTTATSGCTSPPSCSRSPARCSGMSRTASPSRSSQGSWPCLPARPGRDGIASSCSGSTAPAGTPHRTWSCQMGSGSPTCPRTPPSFSPPSTSGPFWMSRSRTATLRPSPIWNARSQTVAGSSTAISSASGQTSIGGPSQPPRANQPEMVSPLPLSSKTHASRSEAPASGLGNVRLQLIGDPMTEIVDVSRIRDLNDQLRRSLTGGVLVMTKGIIALGAQRQLAILSAIAAFDDFSPEDDPYREHDFGALTIEGTRIFKIDYLDRGLTGHSPDPADATVTARVLTVMLAGEY